MNGQTLKIVAFSVALPFLAVKYLFNKIFGVGAVSRSEGSGFTNYNAYSNAGLEKDYGIFDAGSS